MLGKYKTYAHDDVIVINFILNANTKIYDAAEYRSI